MLELNPGFLSYIGAGPLSSYFTAYSLYILHIFSLTLTVLMNPPPRPASPTESAARVREAQPSPEDDLLAVRGQGLQPSPSTITLSEATSPHDLSARKLTPTSLAGSHSLHADVRIHDPPTNDDLLQLPQRTSPNPASLSSTRSSPVPPDELIYTMPQYQPVSAGSNANPRAMSQVSPGFIFVNFLSQSVCWVFFWP
jgi:hypothetical protein